ncbi:DNA alkylation repair protein [Kiloniella laminariae]|uniref:DNA alkylation repair protein n=1 Tax=Kiloniella laminariae TaxID=454162 RepID=A0ABT4LL37_9PROT|nr:DNA alkylation repair protein [Kiloniella laminariae]MCZ4281829.1 DNA alkylation repair protein [Kiloniella laminariae]
MEAFKDVFFNPEKIGFLADNLKRNYEIFDRESFLAEVLENLQTLELKQRSEHITRTLKRYLPEDFLEAREILLACLHPETEQELADQRSDKSGLAGWMVMPLCDYMAWYGKEHLQVSLAALREMTKRSSSEFAIRHFLVSHREETLEALESWVGDPNYHVRRLVSEGSRPRLPWGMRLSGFVSDPAPLLPLLEGLKDDPEEYVRRSVANNLNDIAKDHPDLVAELAQRWMKSADENRKKLVRHACRSLVKDGHKGALAALGFGEPEVSLERFQVLTPRVVLGQALEFEAIITSTGRLAQNLMIDFAIHHQKANGTTSAKVFKWQSFSLAAGAGKVARKRHGIKPITTRKYYPGRHSVELFANGKSLGIHDFELVMENP